MSTRKDITFAILEACKTVLPDVSWNVNVVGVNKSNVVEGAISCDRINLIHEAKGITHASALYNIYILDMSNNCDVDNAADVLFDVFNEQNMGGLCYNVRINSIVYGAIQGYKQSSLCKVEMIVEYPFNV